MDHLLRDLHFVWRAESIVANIQARGLLRQSELRASAALIAIFALFMLNLAGYFGFQQWWGPVWAAIAVAAIDGAIAAVLFALAAAVKPGRELELAREVRGAALESMEVHARNLQDEAVALRDEVCRIRATLAGFAHNPLDTVLPAIVVPLTRALLKTLRKRTAETAPTIAP
jgi:hypothetical protein